MLRALRYAHTSTSKVLEAVSSLEKGNARLLSIVQKSMLEREKLLSIPPEEVRQGRHVSVAY